jgi:hypothetical protein
MNENVEVRFSRLERAPAYKTVSDAILKDIIGGHGRLERAAQHVEQVGTVHRQARGRRTAGGMRPGACAR